MSYYIPKNLTTKNNAKTIKGEKYGWNTHIMYFSAFNQNDSGANVCPNASPGCVSACLVDSGRGTLSNVKKSRLNKTNYFLKARKQFIEQLYNEILNLEKRYAKKGERLCIRLNGTSDLSWEKFNHNGKNLMEHFPMVEFYDYTKNHYRFNRELPSNYHLTFSKSEENQDKVDELLARGFNVAIVFDELPETYKGYEVVNGDESDLRFLDKKGVVVGLKYKRLTYKGADNQEAFKSGFALRKKEVEQEAAVIAA